MSRQMRLVAAVFVLATLLLLFFRSSSWDTQQLRIPNNSDHENVATDEKSQKVVQLPVEGSADEQVFKEEDFEPAQPTAPKAEAGGSDELASHPAKTSSKGVVPEEPTPQAQPSGPQPPIPVEDPKPDEPVPFTDVDVNDTPDSEPDSLAFTAIPSPPLASPTSAPGFDPTSDDLRVDWSRFAYTQYVTDSDYLCNSVMIFESLHRLGSKPDRVMMYPRHMFADPDATAESARSNNAKLIVKARDEYRVKLVPIQVEHREGQDDTWADSYTKLLAFNQTQYSRVLSLDSDSTILRPLDDLFLTPAAPVAMPRAYWLLNDDPPQKILSSQLILLQPSASEFARIKAHIDDAGDNEYDMEIVNELYLDSAMVLPHRPYNMLSAEFRRTDHADYLGSDEEEWDPVKVYNEAKFVHFSDWPVPKPWIRMNDGERVEHSPKCVEKEGGQVDCTDKTFWNELYDNFWKRKQDICV